MAKTNETDYTPVLLVGTFALAYFGVLRPITNALGLTKSADAQQIDSENKAASVTSKWDPNYYKRTTGTRFTDASATNLAKRIYNAWGIFNDDEEEIYGVFRQLTNLIELSQLCDKYFQLYGEDLYARLTAPWYKGNDGLEPQEFNVIAKIVNALPAK